MSKSKSWFCYLLGCTGSAVTFVEMRMDEPDAAKFVVPPAPVASPARP